VLGLALDTLHVEAPEIARDVHHVLIDGSPRMAALMPSAMLASDLVVPAQPSPFGSWASSEMLRLLRVPRIPRPQFVARFTLNLCGPRTVIARETTEALTNPPVLTARVGQRVVFADTNRTV
jgi:chromosome partitioning protein